MEMEGICILNIGEKPMSEAIVARESTLEEAARALERQ